jgi:hypothetical protein
MDDRAGDKGSWRCMCLRSSAWWCKGCDWTRRWIKTCGRVGCDDLQICDDGGVRILPRESFKGLLALGSAGGELAAMGYIEGPG